MRIQRLDLLRYGCFTGVSLDLPAHTPDIHIVFGPNEAGKSTSLSALEDFLFGIPHSSPLNFLHDYGSMRIGAVLQSNGEILDIRRRKGKMDTLRTPGEMPFPAGDAAMARFLAGADRSFFARMFSLDHARLRQGGREILEAKDEVGQMLFSAGTGIAGLRDRLKELDKEADALWASKRAGHRAYYQAEDRLKAADSALREHTVTAKKWQELQKAFESANEAYKFLEQEIADKSAGQKKLSRIRRVYRNVRRSAEIETEIAALGHVTPFAEDARQKLEAAAQDDATAVARIETLNEQLETAREARLALNYDEALLQRADDIQQLHERRIQVRAGKADLPRRRAELSSAEGDLRRLAGELEWEAADIGQLVARIPPGARIAEVRTLMTKRGKLFSEKEGAQTALVESETKFAGIEQELKQMDALVDVSTLAAVIKATSESSDIASRINIAEGERRTAQAAMVRGLQSLKPEVLEETALTSMSVPPKDTVQTHRDDRRKLEQHVAECRARIRAAEQELVRHKKAQDRVARDEHAVPPEEIARVRKHRDAGWSLIRRRFVEGASISEEDVQGFTKTEDDLPAAYEAAVQGADETADRRFDKAEAAARLAVISRQIAEQEDLLESLRGEEILFAAEAEALNSVWQEMWAGAPFLPLPPDAMLEWMGTRTEVLDYIERRITAERQLIALRQEESAAKGSLLKQLEALGEVPGVVEGQPIRVVLKAAEDVQRRHEQKAEERNRLEKELRTASADTKRKRKAVETAESAWSVWQGQWSKALSAAGLSTAKEPEAVQVQAGAIDQMRLVEVKINDLRHERIGKIERDVAAFDHDVAGIVGAVATDLAKAGPEDAAIELERRLDDARRIRDLQTGKDEAIASLEEKIKEHEDSRIDTRAIIRHFQEAAGVDTIDELRTAIEKSDSLRNFKTELSQVTKTLADEGDGLSAAELQRECDAVDLDKIAADEEALSRVLEERRERLMESWDQLTVARQAFEEIGGDSAAAIAAADRQAALAEMKEIAGQYVRVRSATTLLQWAIDRYRREKQGPLLKRAGQLFATLTSGSFSSLQLEFDEQDHAHLAGLRPDGSKTGVGGMTSGTVDQLYLALRVASVEDFLERASPLPFVADDLFINFDDGRAAAGLAILGQLAQKTQVLFFTHHQHLVEIARTTLGRSVSVISLL